jgi:hypothetical protein
MTEHVHDLTGGVVNVSRRTLLAGIGAGVFVLAAGLPTKLPAQEKKFGADDQVRLRRPVRPNSSRKYQRSGISGSPS